MTTSPATLESWPPACWADDRRMGFYFAPIAEHDVEERHQKLSFWRSALLAYLQHTAATNNNTHTTNTNTTHESTPNNKHASPNCHIKPPLSFTLQEVQKGMSRRGDIPPALEMVLCDLLASDEIRRSDPYEIGGGSSTGVGPHNSSRARIIGAIGSYVMSWISPRKASSSSSSSSSKLPPGRYVLVSVVDSCARELLQQLESSQMDLFTFQQIQHISAQRSKGDVEILITHLLHSDSAASYSSSSSSTRLIECFPAATSDSTLGIASTAGTRVFKLAQSGSIISAQRTLTGVDHARGVLGEMIQHLRAQAQEKERYVAEREKEARRLLLEKHRSLALIQLRMKKRCLTHLESLHLQLDNLDVVLHHLEQSISQQEFLSCMKQANATLKQIQTSVNVASVTELTDDLSDQLSQVQLVDDALNQTPATTMTRHIPDDAEVENEFNQLMKEIEQEEAQQTNNQESKPVTPIVSTTSTATKSSTLGSQVPVTQERPAVAVPKQAASKVAITM